ncbi:hypothetical protein [Flavivirga rizhaonensis]|uniref:Uncharacterized protein n=1 Tax=Flavivirga rizhaonensis TaxID=2559571 RepID=A0A4S1DZC5_9FLAO|nr:hypothetical protein [Flavivirga rizhaonensis]TGV03597.1 hypothetical protein EM932_06110 [Flavivirga rizhaonensis]
MQNQTTEEIKEALTTSSDDIPFEQIQKENDSPLNRPVIEKDIGGESVNEEPKNWNVWKPEKEPKTIDDLNANNTTDFRSEVEASVEQEKANEPLDAPEQDINGEGYENEEPITDQDFEVPLAQANQAANAILGMTNNMLAVGGGFFVKITKHKEFYEFEEIVKVIDDQNEKNVKRIKLDAEDMALLRPLLAQVLRKKAKKLTPEQQLLGAIASILIKKGQVVMEVRAENNLLEQRILDIIRAEKGYSEPLEEKVEEAIDEEVEEVVEAKPEPIKTPKPKPIIEDVEVEEVDDEFSNVSILEVAEDKKTDTNEEK